MITRFTRKALKRLGFEVSKIRTDIHQSERPVELLPAGSVKGKVLFSYVVEPFTHNEISNGHTHHWESFCIAQCLLARGYSVDVVSYRNRRFVPTKSYDVFISARTNFDRIAAHLELDCLKIVHLDTAHWLANNASAIERLIDLRDWRHVSIDDRKMVEANQAIEQAHHATILGNGYTIDTYKFSNKPIYRIPISSPATYPPPLNKDYDQCRHHYLWFGSGGLVHKGLDLAIEAFSQMPDKHLAICGPIVEEPEFVEIYRRELYESANIELVGWVDVESEFFINLMNNTLGLVYPSCAEGGGGSVLSCMHGGVIPIVTRETSVDIDAGYGVELKEASIAEIIAQVSRLSELDAATLRNMSLTARNFALKYHTRDSFKLAYENYLDSYLLPLLSDKPAQ